MFNNFNICYKALKNVNPDIETNRKDTHYYDTLIIIKIL